MHVAVITVQDLQSVWVIDAVRRHTVFKLIKRETVTYYVNLMLLRKNVCILRKKFSITL